jgi:hypothetical protein
VAVAKIIEPNVAGGRNTTWPSVRCGASRAAMSGCAKAGGFGDIRCHQCELCFVPALRIFDDDTGARRAMFRNLSRVAPPQAHVMALKRKIARARE